jgi:shikimate kinase
VASPLLLLIGLRCSGKTTLGQLAARTLNVPFQDLDPLALARLGRATVTEAFEKDGEEGWRRAEALALKDVLAAGAGVLSLGGGTPTAPGAAAAIRSAQSTGRTRVALLHPGERELLRRLAAGRGDRPRLGQNDASEVAHLAAQRLPLYRSLADAVLDTRLETDACVRRLAALVTVGH